MKQYINLIENNMNPQEFEKHVGNLFRKDKYEIQYTPASGDNGVDIFAVKGDEKIAIQVKQYGGSTRKVNRQMIRELHGAKDYYDCTKAIMATDGELMADAKEVAEKLGIEVLYIKDYDQSQIDFSHESISNEKNVNSTPQSFDWAWEKYIVPLVGKEISLAKGGKNKIVKVSKAGITRITSNGNVNKIDIEIFNFAYTKVMSSGYVSRDEINQSYPKRGSSGVIAILKEIPFIELTELPQTGIRINKNIL